MRRLHLLVEGQTEETIVGDLIVPHFESLRWYVSVSILTTRRVAGQPARRGGVSSWRKIHRELQMLLPSRYDVLTTVIDYYGCPLDTPGMDNRPTGGARARVEHVEAAIASTVDHPCFVPHLVLHETEAWVLAAVDYLGSVLDDEAGAASVKKVVDESGGPEMVNDGPTTAPSKRLLAQWPTYQKTLDGPLALIDMGLGGVRRRCPHLDAWLRRIEEWPVRS